MTRETRDWTREVLLKAYLRDWQIAVRIILNNRNTKGKREGR